MQRIILVRHGEVDIKDNNRVSAYQFKEWINEYNNASIKTDIFNENEITELLKQTDMIICSNLKRSIESLQLFNEAAFEVNDIFNEAALPSSNWMLLKFKPKYG